MSIIFQCSLSKANRLKERKLLIEAGLLLPIQNCNWIRYKIDGWRPEGVLTLEYGFTNSINLILTAKQFLTIVLAHKVAPHLKIADLLGMLKLNQRNKWVLKHSNYRHILDD